MNTNKQKSLAQIAYNVYFEASNGTCESRWNQIASAVKQAVLAELPEWGMIHPSDAKAGDEWFKLSGCEWAPVTGKEQFADFMPIRRRIQPSPTPEVHVATEDAERKTKFKVGDTVRIPSVGFKGTVEEVRWASVGPIYKVSDFPGFPTESELEPSTILPQPPVTPAANPILVGLADYVVDLTNSHASSMAPKAHLKDFITSLERQLQQVTKERDEARKWAEQLTGEKFSDRNHGALKSRAEAAEKNLAEVEKSLRFEKEAFLRQSQDLERLHKKLASHQWTSTASRLPTKDDADANGQVWIPDRTPFHPVCEIHHSNVGPDGYKLWMTPLPLPTPPEEKEDAFEKRAIFEKWWDENSNKVGVHSTIKNMAMVAFFGGQQSKL